jgi:hypothetical protein
VSTQYGKRVRPGPASAAAAASTPLRISLAG